jgi:hypothetical protein
MIVAIRRNSGLWNGYAVHADYVYRYAGTGAALTHTGIEYDHSAEDALNANIGQVNAIACDKDDNLFIVVADNTHNTWLILKVNGYHGAMTLYYGAGTYSYNSCPVNSAKPMTTSYGIAVDSSNAVYFSLFNCYRIMRIDPETKLSYVYAGMTAGYGQPTSSGTTLAILTKIGSPRSIVIDADDNLYYADNAGYVNVIRKSDQLLYMLVAPIGTVCSGVCDNFITIATEGFVRSLAVDQHRNLAIASYSSSTNFFAGIITGISLSPPTTYPTTTPSYSSTINPSGDNTANTASINLNQSSSSRDNSMTFMIFIIIILCIANLIVVGISCYLFIYVKRLLSSFSKTTPDNEAGEEAEAMLPQDNADAPDAHYHARLESYPIDQIYSYEDATASINLGNQEFGGRGKHMDGAVMV